jgi:hypothetical protein
MDTGDPSSKWWREFRLPQPDLWSPCTTYVERDPSTRAAISERIAREHPYGPRMERDLTADDLAWAARTPGPATPDWISVSPLQQVALSGWWASEIREAVRDSPTTRRNTRSTGRIGTVFHEMLDGGVVSTTRDGAVIKTTKRKPRRNRCKAAELRPSQICAFFQLQRSCDRPATCSYTHVCATCTSSDHGAVTCPRANHVTPHRAVGAGSPPTGMAAETHPVDPLGLGAFSLVCP